MKRLDWDALKAEWLSGSETLNAFRLRKKISSTGHFYQMVEDGGWVETRERIRTAASQQIEGRLAKDTAKTWNQYRRLITDCLSHAKRTLAKTKDGGLKPLELNQLVASIEKLLKAESFLDGGPSERIENPASAPAITHQHIVALIGMLNAKDPSVVIPETLHDLGRA